jgi:tetratricopeptide (TPR) repeat protein
MELASLLDRAQSAFSSRRYPESRDLLMAFLDENPNSASALRSLGLVSARLGQTAQAFRYLRQALQADPHDSEAHFSLALLYLQHGNYQHGFIAYEWRLNRERCLVPRYARGATLWDGRALDEEALMLHCEQGFGDNLQFIRFLPRLRDRVKKIYLACHPELVRLFSGFEGLAGIVTDRQPVPKCEFHCPLLSLARIFQVTMETLPRSVPYLPVPRTPSGEKLSRKRIGLAWRASRASPNGAYRSVPLADLQPLAGLPVDWISLQKDPDAQERKILADDFRAQEQGSTFHDFQDTADCVQALDLVLTVDTSVAHLAGALGRPTFLLLPKWTDWRWLLDRADSPWYPTMTLFRQENDGDWSHPLAALEEKLRAGLSD